MTAYHLCMVRSSPTFSCLLATAFVYPISHYVEWGMGVILTNLAFNAASTLPLFVAGYYHFRHTFELVIIQNETDSILGATLPII